MKLRTGASVLLISMLLASPALAAMGHDSTYSTGYENGKSYGYSVGYSAGLADGKKESQSGSYNSGYQDGYESGYQDGYESGYQDGYESGYQDGYDLGLDEGRTESSLTKSEKPAFNIIYGVIAVAAVVFITFMHNDVYKEYKTSAIKAMCDAAYRDAYADAYEETSRMKGEDYDV